MRSLKFNTKSDKSSRISANREKKLVRKHSGFLTIQSRAIVLVCFVTCLLLVYFCHFLTEVPLQPLASTLSKEINESSSKIFAHPAKNFRDDLKMSLNDSEASNFNIKNSYFQVGNASEFIAEREVIYRHRRERVAQTCALLRRYGVLLPYSLPDDSRAQPLVHLPEKRLFYCFIPKVASTTWSSYLLQLTGIPRRLGKGSQPFLGKHFYPRISQKNGLSALLGNETLSLVIVRHPFSRLVSAYHSKFVQMGFNKWNKVRRYVIAKFRRGGYDFLDNEKQYEGKRFPRIEDDPRLPTPSEYLKYVLYNLKESRPDPHWLPMYKSCPFCEHNFTIYSKLEEMALDKRYFLERTGLPEGALAEQFNPSSASVNRGRDRRFWASVDTSTLRMTVAAYKIDSGMFGYSFKDYFKHLGLSNQE